MVCTAGYSTDLHTQAVVVDVHVPAVVVVVVAVGTAVSVVLQLSISPALSPTRTLFVASATSVALGTFDCSRTNDFCSRRSLIVCLHV